MKTKTARLTVMHLLPALLVSGLIAGTMVLANRKDDRSAKNDSATAPINLPEKGGCSVWSGRRLRSINSDVLTVQFTLGLGRISADGETGHISLREKVITANSYTPDVLALSFFAKGPTEMVRDPARPQRVIADPGEKGGYTSQSIKQVKGPETFMDIVVLNEWAYEMRLYQPDQVRSKRNGFYRVEGEPYSVTLVRNPNPPKTNSIEITTTKDGIAKKSEWKYDEESDTWTYFLDGVETSRKQSEVSATNPCERVETRFDLKDGKWVRTLKLFKAFPWGQEIIQKVEDEGGELQVTNYEYFEDPDGPHYTFLKNTIHPDGTVERHNRHPDPFKKNP
jgi:hypothetical protein